MLQFNSIFNTIYNDASQPWQLGFQDSAAPGFTGLVTLHNTISFYLIVICFGVFWVLGSTIYYYNSNNSPIVHKYLNHGTLIELIWTISPALILIAIAFPSFKLLYLMDMPLDLINKINYLSIVPISKIYSPSIRDLVVYGKLGSTVNIHLSNDNKLNTVFTSKIISKIIGHLLDDGYLIISITSVNPYFVFTQTIKRLEYIYFVYLNLSHYCIKFPILNKSCRKGIFSNSLQIHTRNYPLLLILHSLFYKKNLYGYKKVINYDILPYLNEISLAY